MIDAAFVQNGKSGFGIRGMDNHLGMRKDILETFLENRVDPQ
jgi:hypothetical protein